MSILKNGSVSQQYKLMLMLMLNGRLNPVQVTILDQIVSQVAQFKSTKLEPVEPVLSPASVVLNPSPVTSVGLGQQATLIN